MMLALQLFYDDMNQVFRKIKKADHSNGRPAYN